MLVTAYLFVMGLVWGSFLNVVVYRTAKGKSPMKGRSICPKCKKQLPWKYNIPLISFLFLHGKCGFCQKKISWRYPFIELMTGVMFVWWYLVGYQFFKLFGNPWQIVQPFFWLTVGMSMLTVFMTDFFYGVIPLSVNLFFFSLVLLYRVALTASGVMQVTDFWGAIFSGLILCLFFIGLQKFAYWWRGRDGIGWGDILLSPTLGLLLGFPRILVGMMMAFVSGATIGLILIWMNKKKMSQTIPFGPFLILGTAIALIWGDVIWKWYVSMLQ